MSRKKSKIKPPVNPPVSKRKIWYFRLMALLVAPMVLLGSLELGLRLAGVGHPTAFLLASSNQGRKTLIQNDQFGWRFFGPRMSREPHAISIAKDKTPGVVRIFVFGESAAFGDPQPRYGLPRMLEAILELRHPGVKFEVVNAAMTGINSHTILPIARDCADAGGDIWVIYAGNNEVVGPFGAGTVFGPQAPPLPLIRTSLALKTMRTAQLFDMLTDALRPPPPLKSEWGGMQMFINQRVRADDARMTNVYRNFKRNLDDIIQAGLGSGARIVLSTVAVNLKDCAPFASLHRADLSAEQLANWEANFNRGKAALQAGQFSAAESALRAAAAIDDTYAELRYGLGQCALERGASGEAMMQLSAARDLDALRFRCDSRLNELIKQTGADHEREGVLLADAAQVLAAASPDGLPGAEFFYEHVHLTWEGNYALARTLAEQVERCLPGTDAPAARAWPEIAECARRLARTNREEQQALTEVLGRLNDPPFTWQLNHGEQVAHLAAEARQLAPADAPVSLEASLAACQTALAAFPGDPLLYQQLSELKQATKNYAEAAAAARQSLELLPSNPEVWLLLGLALAQLHQYDDAAAAFRRDFALDADDVWARHNLALCLQKMGQPEAAIREFRRALAIKPRFGIAWLGMGQVYEEMGRTNEAADCYQKALANPIHRASELTTLARFCQNRKWYAAASTNYAEAIKLNPSDPNLRMEAGITLAALDHHAEAAQCFTAATQLSPDWGQAYFLCGLEYGRLGDPAAAEKQFQEAVRLLPSLPEARLNLGMALYLQQKLDSALSIFTGVLQIDPTNAMAIKYVQTLRAMTSNVPVR